MMNLKEIRTERSWPNESIVPPFAWRNSGGGKKRKKKSDVPAGCLTNTGLNSDTVSKEYKSHQDVSYLKTF